MGECHPKTDAEMDECATLGKSLSRMSQPTILTLMARSGEPMHGYIIVQQAANSPMFGGKKPDATGIYRALKRMEQALRNTHGPSTLSKFSVTKPVSSRAILSLSSLLFFSTSICTEFMSSPFIMAW